MRNFHQGFEHGLLEGLVKAGIQQVMRGGNLGPDGKNHAGYTRMERVDALGPEDANKVQMLGNAKGDGKLTFDRLTDVYHSGTRHDEDQPVHLVVEDLNICSSRCVREYGNPCQYFCPAAVYEMVDADAATAGRGGDAAKGIADQFHQLRALQDLRHHGPVPDHQLGSAGGGRGSELRRDVSAIRRHAVARKAECVA